jgi:glycosyltransferase involved in cell wall biosynthesis
MAQNDTLIQSDQHSTIFAVASQIKQPMKDVPSPAFDFLLLIPFYNNLTGLIRSLHSISYSPVKYGVLIVDDGSDTPLQHSDLASFAATGVFIHIIRMPRNQGITRALNAGLHWLQDRKDFSFVARLDCGDLCATTRFERQVAFLRQHADTDLVGSWCIFTNYTTGLSYRYSTPTEHKDITRGMYFRNIFIHPTVMWRAGVTEKAGIYPETFPHAEDYGFFYEIINKGKGAVIPEDLVICEINPKGLSLHFRKQQLKSRIRVVRQYGKSKALSLIGVAKLWLLLATPYKIVLQTKKLLYGIKPMNVI